VPPLGLATEKHRMHVPDWSLPPMPGLATAQQLDKRKPGRAPGKER